MIGDLSSLYFWKISSLLNRISSSLDGDIPFFLHVAYCFNSAGTKTALQVRNLNLDAEHLKRIVTIADQ